VQMGSRMTNLMADKPFPEPVDEFNRYRIGIMQTAYNPAEQEVKEMLHLIAYDISTLDAAGQKRLRLVAKTCEDYGVRVERSVFECDLEEREFSAFWAELSALIDPECDALIAYRLCRGCVSKTLSAGLVARPAPVLIYLP